MDSITIIANLIEHCRNTNIDSRGSAVMILDAMYGTPCEQIRHQQEVEELQAKIDSLMLEYCPDDMTPEQVERWKNSQCVDCI